MGTRQKVTREEGVKGREKKKGEKEEDEAEDDDEEDLQSSFLLQQPFSGSSTPTRSSGNGSTAPAASKKKRNLPGNPGKQVDGQSKLYVSHLSQFRLRERGNFVVLGSMKLSMTECYWHALTRDLVGERFSQEPWFLSTRTKNLYHPPDPDAEVVALSPRTLMATNRYMCEVCHKGFQRDQNLQLHRRGHNLPWKLKQRSGAPPKKRVYVCPETTCVHHDPSRALGDLTGIKKHFCRKHGEKKWKCDKCSKRYAVQSDWKAHAKICGTKEYRRDSFITHRAFCDALTEENNRVQQQQDIQSQKLVPPSMPTSNPISPANASMNLSLSNQMMNSSLAYLNHPPFQLTDGGAPVVSDHGSLQASGIQLSGSNSPGLSSFVVGSGHMSATALLQKAAAMGAMISDNSISPVLLRGFAGHMTSNGQQIPVQDPGQAGAEAAMPDSHLLMPPSSSSQNANMGSNHFQGGFMGGSQQGVEGGNRTVDFLGLGPTEQMGIGEGSFHQSAVGVRYSDEQQQQQNMHSSMNSYHFVSSDPSAMEKSMWNF
ncbi:hypothetical protein ACLOJK_038926 [Asimina triloba]